MIDKNDHLYDLIASLKSSEKRYFKLYAQRHIKEGKSSYVALFEKIEAQVNKRKKKTIDAASSKKKYLYNTILNSLNAHNHQIDKQSQLPVLIANAKSLRQKQLLKASLKLIDKAKKLAYLIEDYYALLEIFDLETEIRLQLNIFDPELLNEKNETFRRVNVLDRLMILKSKIASIGLSVTVVREDNTNIEIKQIIESLNNMSNEVNFIKGKIHLYNLLSMCHSYNIENKMEQALYYAQKHVTQMEQLPCFIRNNMAIYSQSLRLLSSYEIKQSQDLNRVTPIFDKLMQLIVDYKIQEPSSIYLDIRLTILFNKFVLAMRNHLIIQVEKTVAEAVEFLKKHWKNIPPVLRCYLTYNVSYAFFYLQDYKNALYWANQLVMKNPDQVPQNILPAARILSLVVHYEIKNIELLPYIERSARRILKKKETLYKSEKILLHFFRSNLVQAKDKNQQVDSFKQFKKEFAPILEDPLEKNILIGFNFLNWIDSKIEGRSFAEVAKESEAK